MPSHTLICLCEINTDVFIICIKILKKIFASHPVIVVLEEYSKKFIDQTWQIWNLTITVSLPTAYNYLQSKVKKKKKKTHTRFLFPPAKQETSDLRAITFHCVRWGNEINVPLTASQIHVRIPIASTSKNNLF